MPSRTILIVEDEALIAMATRMILERHGFGTLTACTALAAINLVDTVPAIDLILMDIDLGHGMDGTAAAKVILEKRDLPLVFLSAHTEPAVVEKTEGITSYGYIVKNSGDTILLASIKMAFKLFEARQQEARKEAALEKSEARYRQLFENMTTGFALHEMLYDSSGQPVDYRYLAVNPAFEALTGLRAEQLIGHTVMEVLPDTEPYWIATYGQVVLTGQPLRYTNFSRELDKHFDVWAFSPAPDQFAVIFSDVSEQRQAEQALQESEELYRRLYQQALDDLFIHTLDGRILDANAAACRNLGYTRAELQSMNIGDLNVPETADQVTDRFSRLDHDGMVRFDASDQRKDGSIIFHEVMAQKITWHGQPAVLAVCRDISERKRIEQALYDERQRLAGILRGTNVGTWEWNVQSGETVFNERWAEIIGYSLAELAPVAIGTWLRFGHPDDLAASQALLQKHFTGELEFYECEARMRHKDGSWVWVLDRGKVVSWTADGKPLMMMGTHQDITERKQHEEFMTRQLQDKEILLREGHPLQEL
jgi:PAS domain S-box-containing protein